MGHLDGMCGLVVGIANQRSLATHIARAAQREGALLAVTYQNEALAKHAAPLAVQLGAELCRACDVTHDAEIAALAAELTDRFGRLDFVVHSVAAARRQDLDGPLVDVGRAGFLSAMDASVFSLIALARALGPLLEKSSSAPSFLTLSYYGAQKVVPNYHVMGIAKAALEASVRYLAAELGPHGVRVNAVSAGPVKTLSAAGVRGLRTMLARVAEDAPLRRNISGEQVAEAAVFLLSKQAEAITGEILHVDAGFHIVGTSHGES